MKWVPLPINCNKKILDYGDQAIPSSGTMTENVVLINSTQISHDHFPLHIPVSLVVRLGHVSNSGCRVREEMIHVLHTFSPWRV